MPPTDIQQTTTTEMDSKVPDYSVQTMQLDSAYEQDETFWDNTEWTQYLGYYKKVPEFKSAINAYATWCVGKGYTTDPMTQALLDNIRGWGEDTFQSILWNMLVIKKISGDAFAEIIKNDNGTLINLKPLDPGSVRIVANKKGMVKRYEYRKKVGNKKEFTSFEPKDILHLCNDRVADEIHGTSITESIEWVILARNEAMADWKRLLHRSTIRVLEVDEDDKDKLANIKRDYASAIKKGEVMLVPKGSAEFKDTPFNYVDPQQWIKYLEDFFYQALGVPKVILGGSSEFTEASSKTAYLTYEQVYRREMEELQNDLWNQLALKVTFVKPASLKSEMLSSEEKNTGQVGFQPNETQAQMGRVE